jgi:phage-related protein/DNA-binding XRE family transcriptional regulator
MAWRVEFLDDDVRAELESFALDIRASFLRISRLIESEGLHKVREPYVKHLDGPLWEIRMRGKDGIARAAYVTATGQRVVVVRVFAKKTQKTPRREIELAPEKGKGGSMTRSTIPVEDAAREWMKDPEFRAAYDALDDEFALAAALIKARGDADMTQEQVAVAMGTTQAAIARLESGRIRPTTRTLEQYAKATHTRLRISFEPEMANREAKPAL